MNTYIALLRGINVGGHNQVSMADLRALLTQLGFADVRSLLQSGNLVFGANGRTATQLERLLDAEAEKRLGLQTDFFVRTAKEWKDVVAHNPFSKEAARDPASVGEEWRQLFDNGKLAELPVIPTSRTEVLGSGEQGAVPSAAAEATAPRSPLPVSANLTPITGPAARLAQNMTDSLSVPTATSFREITVDVLDARRRELNGQLAAAGKKISFTHLIGFAIARAARELPVMTHAFQDVDGKPHRFDPRAVNLGLAVDVEKKDRSHALVVPVIKHAEGMDFATFHATYETLVDKARTNKLVPDDFAGATITLTRSEER